MKNNKMKKPEKARVSWRLKMFFAEPEGHQEVRDKNFVHVSRVQTTIFHFYIYVVFEILTVFI